jgi:alkylation response protein AidB-like acyl-CoA dehydrogenase
MRLGSDEPTERFRAELRAWLAAHQPSAAEMRAEPFLSSAHLPGWARAWQRRLFDAGWLVPGWPRELGGRDATPVQQLVYFEEFARIQLWRSYNIQGLTIVAPSIRDYGNAWQQERYVMPTLRAEISWCLGMSEPSAGSDLAALSTRAELRGDRWLVSGQKIWTSGAQHADFCFCFVRTDPAAPKHRGLSVLIVDMRSRGIQVRPLPDLTDPARADFNQVFFDGVEVPRDHLVGREGGGWEVSHGSLAHERGMLWTMQVARIERRLQELLALGAAPGADGRPRREDARFRDRLASLWTQGQALKFMGYQGFAKVARGRAAPEHSLMKLLGSELEQQICLFAAEEQAPESLEVGWERHAEDPELAKYPPSLDYLRSFANTIAGGTSEIQRNIIAQRVLRLPRR